MKIKKLGILTLVGLIIGLTSCGGKKGESEEPGSLTPETTQISGNLGEYFTVVDRSYKIVGNLSKRVTIEFQRTNAELPEEITNAKEITSWSSSSYHTSSGVMINLTVEFLDNDGNILGKRELSSSSEIQSLLKLKPGEKGSVEFLLPTGCDDATKFRISSQYETYEESESSGSSSSSGSESASESDNSGESVSSSTSSASSSDVDALLKSYEEYIDKYIAIIKKAKNNDMTALAEYPGLMQKAQELGDKIESCKGDLTSAQLAKFNKLHAKLLKAAQEM